MTDWSLAINVTVTGIVLVFSMLVLLVCILILFGKISESLKKASDKKAEKARAEALAAMSSDNSNDEQNVATVTKSSDNLSSEVVAAISAAISVMYMGSAKKPVIKSIKKSSGRCSAWANAGIQNNTRSF